MAFPPGFLDELRGRLSLAGLVGKRVRLTRRGHEHAGLCPFHNEKTPSFYVVEDKGFFHCFGCGAHGDAVGFVMRAENLDFVEAVTRLAGEAGLAVPQSSPDERERARRRKTLLETLAAAAQFYETRLWSPAGTRAREYLAARGLDEATIRRFRLGWAGDDRHALAGALGGDFPPALLLEAGLVRRPEGGGEAYDYFRGRVIFPIGDRAGRTIAFGGRTLGDGQPKYLNSPETPLFEKGRVLYGWSAARAAAGGAANPTGAGAAEIIVTEGYMDVIALSCAGFGGAVAPLGTALTEAQLGELWRLAPEPVICFDGDAAGARAALRALNRALPLLRPGQSLRFAALPPGEDPDSLIRARGPSGFAEILAAAQPLSELLWRSALAQRPLDTPERRADLERRLMDEVARIEDRSVQAEYRRFLRDRLFAASRAARPAPRSAARASNPRRFPRPGAPPPATLREGPPPPPRLPGRVQREILLHMLLVHPFLVAEASEDIAQLDVPEPELDALRRAILEAEVGQPGLDAEALRQHLADNGFAPSVDALVSSSVDHAGFLGRASDPQSVRLGWEHVKRMVHEGDRSERASVAAALSQDMSPATWDRFLAVRGREMQEDVAADELSPHGLDDGAR
jgi:DNA primase